MQVALSPVCGELQLSCQHCSATLGARKGQECCMFCSSDRENAPHRSRAAPSELMKDGSPGLLKRVQPALSWESKASGAGAGLHSKEQGGGIL